jgi:hypothetical protein
MGKITSLMLSEGISDLPNGLKHERIGIVFKNKVQHILLGPFVQKTIL